MNEGIQLRLWAGPGIPRPVPPDLANALVAAEVVANAHGTSKFQLRFQLSNRSPLHTLFLLAGSSALNVFRVIIAVVVSGRTEVIMDGIVTHQQVVPGDSPGRGELVVSGDDLSAAMDWFKLDGVPYPSMPLAARVLAILAKYAVLGIVPMVVPAVIEAVASANDRIERQQGSDLAYIRYLADQTGYVFYLEPGPVVGANRAYWGPEIKLGEIQPAINVDFDGSSNTDQLNFSYDAENAVQPILYIQDETLKAPIPVPVPDITPLNPPLGLVPPLRRREVPMPCTAKLSVGQAALLAMAQSSRQADAVSATGSIDVARYGRVLKPRRLVGARGVGHAFDGLYYVRQVTHQIARGSYKQSFELSRNGLISTLPRIPA
jgi:hypothetical protein